MGELTAAGIKLYGREPARVGIFPILLVAVFDSDVAVDGYLVLALRQPYAVVAVLVIDGKKLIVLGSNFPVGGNEAVGRCDAFYGFTFKDRVAAVDQNHRKHVCHFG